MSGAIPPIPHYTFMAWGLVKAQGQLYIYLYLYLPFEKLGKMPARVTTVITASP
jgi:hypothetical protein